jgi:hypothetical protein
VSVELSDQATEEVCSFVVRIQKKYINSKCIMIIINVFLEFQLPEEEIPAAQVINCDQSAFISLLSARYTCAVYYLQLYAGIRTGRLSFAVLHPSVETIRTAETIKMRITVLPVFMRLFHTFTIGFRGMLVRKTIF